MTTAFTKQIAAQIQSSLNLTKGDRFIRTYQVNDTAEVISFDSISIDVDSGDPIFLFEQAINARRDTTLVGLSFDDVRQLVSTDKLVGCDPYSKTQTGAIPAGVGFRGFRN